MGIFSKMAEKRKQKTIQKNYDLMLHGYEPVFTSFGKNIYSSDIVQSVIKCITDELLKSQPMHVKQADRSITPVSSDISKVLENPNDLMTIADFICKITYLYETQYNVFIYPMWQFYTDTTGKVNSRLTGLYPLNPMTTQFFEDTSGALFVEFTFIDGSKTGLLPYENLIHWRKDFTENDYMGGDINGRANITGLLKTLQANNTLLESVPNAIKASYQINGILQYGSLVGQDLMKTNLEQFNERLKTNTSGIATVDMGGSFNQITRDIKLVDDATLKFIDEKILRFFKVPLCILTGDYTMAQHEAFVQSTIEPLLVTLGQAFTKTLFSKQASYGYGNKIVFYYDKITSMSTDQQLKVVAELGGRGALTNNTILAMFGLPPYEDGDKRYMSLNYVDVNIANEYQMNRAKSEGAKGGTSEE